MVFLDHVQNLHIHAEKTHKDFGAHCMKYVNFVHDPEKQYRSTVPAVRPLSIGLQVTEILVVARSSKKAIQLYRYLARYSCIETTTAVLCVQPVLSRPAAFEPLKDAPCIWILLADLNSQVSSGCNLSRRQD